MPKRALLLILFAVLVVAAVVPNVLAEEKPKHCNPAHPCPGPTPSASASASPSSTPPTTPPPGPSSSPSSTPPTTPVPGPSSSPSGTSRDPVITAAGDIADPAASSATHATANLVESINPSVAITLGDNQYPSGLLSDYMRGYDSTWGAFLSRTSPAPGNHEYKSSPNAAGYFAYFGVRAPGPYYSYDVGAWHVISLDSNCSYIGGCDAGSPEYQWLQADLASHPTTCTLAYWHHPRWSSGQTHGGTSSVAPFWTLLYDAGAELVLNGHEHNYERFAPQDPSGRLDQAKGIVEIVAGTGGHGLYPLGSPDANSVTRSDTSFGVLELTLHPSSYDFQFQPIPGDSFTDSGSESCH
jgi:acid phosphatase type 7